MLRRNGLISYNPEWSGGSWTISPGNIFDNQGCVGKIGADVEVAGCGSKLVMIRRIVDKAAIAEQARIAVKRPEAKSGGKATGAVQNPNRARAV
jgi:hypothetical protein